MHLRQTAPPEIRCETETCSAFEPPALLQEPSWLIVACSPSCLLWMFHSQWAGLFFCPVVSCYKQPCRKVDAYSGMLQEQEWVAGAGVHHRLLYFIGTAVLHVLMFVAWGGRSLTWIEGPSVMLHVAGMMLLASCHCFPHPPNTAWIALPDGDYCKILQFVLSITGLGWNWRKTRKRRNGLEAELMNVRFLWVCFLRYTCVGSLRPSQVVHMWYSLFLSQGPKLSLQLIPAKSVDFLRPAPSYQMQSR